MDYKKASGSGWGLLVLFWAWSFGADCRRLELGAPAFCFVVIIYKNHAKKAYFEKSLFFIQSQGGAWARSVAFVFVADAFAPCRAFLGLLRGCAFAWSVFVFRHFAQIGRFDFWLLLWYNYNVKRHKTGGGKIAPAASGGFNMSFEQTKIFRDLVEHFTKFANEHRNFVGCDQMAAEMVARWSRVHGPDRIAKVAKKANQKAKVKFYSV